MEKTGQGDPDSFPKLKKAGDSINPGGEYKGVTLLPGWLITKIDRKGKDKVYSWSTWEGNDMEEHHRNFAYDLLQAVDARITSITSDECFLVLQIFDATALIDLHCGRRIDGEVRLTIHDVDYDIYGVEECKKTMEVVSKMPHIVESEMNFNTRLGHQYTSRLKEAVFAGFWKSFCPEWIIAGYNKPIKQLDVELISLQPVVSTTCFESMFEMTFSDESKHIVRLHEQIVYSSFYANKEIFAKAQPPTCTLLDIALAKGEPEATA